MPYFPLALIRNIRAARKKANLTQEQIAKELNLAVISYGKLERGERPISLARLTQIAEVLDVTIYDLLDGCVPGAPPVSKLQPNLSHSDEIAELASACSPEGRRLIRDIAWLLASDYDI